VKWVTLIERLLCLTESYSRWKYITENPSHVVVAASTQTYIWTAGYRVNATDKASSFIWRVVTANHYFKFPHTFTYWAPREPNGGETEYCMALDVYRNYRWFDETCTRNHHVLCEIDIA